MIITINGIEWILLFVYPDDPVLWMQDDFTLGVTDVQNRIIYISNDLYGEKLYNVIWHELTHAWLYSYEYQIDLPCEELICQIIERDSDYIQDYADEIYMNL